ncbi:MAG: rhodanese-like domain-containing protein [Ignavibacteria bacterium]|nr:rhodanese-like domain-containing protein [Ignavibacteria bacterium]MCU7503436.1 rhodanese-like domain-containing protein [Ignavibacteria bacterium]MCU7516232.1 rhodanese-like domain-containing protein [Ignavibacteria bacterium]
MRSYRIFTALLALVLLYGAGCAQEKDKDSQKNMDITVEQLKEKMKSDSSLVVLDVRTPEELKGPLGKIDGAVNIPVDQLEERIAEVEKLKGKDIAVICRSGHRSKRAQGILDKHGIKTMNVLGGMTGYRK